MITPEMIRARLAKLQENSTQRDLYMKPPSAYEEFMPATMGYQPRDMSLFGTQLDNIGEQGRNATDINATKYANAREHSEMVAQRRELTQATKRLAKLKANQPKRIKQQVQPGVKMPQRTYRNYQGTRNFSNKWGADNTPEVSDINTLRPNAQIVNVNWQGREFNVNRQVAPIFVAFLDDLRSMGYKPVSIGGHSPRNIAGTNTPSLHSYGMAIDIDPSSNPVQSNDGSMQMKLPPRVASLAAKYGLSWGGSWNSYKDPMHFSVPYGGTE